MLGFGPIGAAPIGATDKSDVSRTETVRNGPTDKADVCRTDPDPSPEHISLDPNDPDVRRRLLAAGWRGEPLINLHRSGGKIYFCWESED